MSRPPSRIAQQAPHPTRQEDVDGHHWTGHQTVISPEAYTSAATGSTATNQNDASLSQPGASPSFRTSRTADAFIVEVSGEIDMTTAPELEHAISSADPSTPRVVVNLSEVSFLDCSALNTLIRSNRQLEEQAIPLRLVISPGRPHIRKVFEITQLTAALGVVETLDRALNHEAPEPPAAA